MSQRLPKPIDALRSLVERNGWTDGQCAEALGMRRSHFSEVMSGKRRLPLEAIRAAVKLGVPAEVLLQPFPCEVKR